MNYFFVHLLLSVSVLLTLALRPNIRLINLSNNLVPYMTAWDYQRRLLHHHIELQQNDDPPYVGTLLILQHPPVYTFGTATESNAGPFDLITKEGDRLSYEVAYVERGGQATYHGPGQIVMYPIFDLNYFEKDINEYLRNLEEIVINTCKAYKLSTNRVEGLTGVWVENTAKIAAIGIKLRRWVTMHGLALNVDPDLRYFSNIIPCGITDKQVTSMKQYIPDIQLQKVKDTLLTETSGIFNVKYPPSLYLEGQAGLDYLDALPTES